LLVTNAVVAIDRKDTPPDRRHTHAATFLNNDEVKSTENVHAKHINATFYSISATHIRLLTCRAAATMALLLINKSRNSGSILELVTYMEKMRDGNICNRVMKPCNWFICRY
jgi:hypothetical protein